MAEKKSPPPPPPPPNRGPRHVDYSEPRPSVESYEDKWIGVQNHRPPPPPPKDKK